MVKPQIHKAVANCCITRVKDLLEQGADVDARDRRGKTALHWAVNRNYRPLIYLLLEKGAQINVKDNEGYTPLHLAIPHGGPYLVKKLLNKGAETGHTDECGQTPLHMAALALSWTIYEMLLSAGASWDSQDSSGRTPLQVILNRELGTRVDSLNVTEAINTKNEKNETFLHKAVKKCHVNVVKQLLRFGADTNIKDRDGLTPLHIAVNKNLRQVIASLVKSGAKVNEQNNKGEQPLHVAVLIRNIKIMADLVANGADIEGRNNDNETALLVAVKNNCVGEAKFLVERGADMNVQDSINHCVLYYVSRYKSLKIFKKLMDKGINLEKRLESEVEALFDEEDLDLPIFSIIKWNYLSAVSLVLQRGIDVHLKNSDGETLLHVLSKHSTFIRMLLDRGAVIEARNNMNQTPLFNAVKVENGSAATAKVLLSRGAEVNMKDEDGRTPLHYAAESAIAINSLLNSGADIEARDNMGQTPLFSAVMFSLYNFKDCSWTDSYSSDSYERLGIENLVARGANVNAKDNEGRTVLFVQGISLDTYQYLLDHGADVDVKDNSGQTPLHVAGSLCRFEELLKKGANIDVADNAGITPLQILLKEIYMIPSVAVEAKNLFYLRNKYGFSIIHLAARATAVKLTEQLLMRGACVNDKDNYGNTPLHLAAASHEGESVETCDELLKNGAEIDSQNNNGNTPLLSAVCSYHDDTIGLLLLKGARMDIVNKDGHTPLSQFEHQNDGPFNPLKNHIVKLKVVHLEEDITCDMNSVDISGYESFEASCVKELEKMKAVKCGNMRFLLTDVVFKYKDPVFVTNCNIGEIIESPDLKDKYPIYAHLLKEKYKSAKERYSLLGSTEFNVVVETDGADKLVELPREIKRRILSELRDSDLRNLIKANNEFFK